ncbi:hypothetical protein PXW65_03855 [Klebsiella quasipneumoniae subsp. similipneumoniae]|uniref:hypothetical protein n=1 Tax=Klebsiella quasipneumoniae TaxID=1463165 RepID=UPI00237FE974|nr:hypothetical protein [Klebsiella quasipneumoniae]MDE4793188.1 hypothetical protein [Klebsiella quasipneumoniae subsp. similipneumoniae]
MALWQRLTGWLAFLSNGEAGQQDTQRVMEAILPVASLYGVDIGNVEPGGSVMIRHTERRRTREAYWNEVCFV